MQIESGTVADTAAPSGLEVASASHCNVSKGHSTMNVGDHTTSSGLTALTVPNMRPYGFQVSNINIYIIF
jgi:hypothetical protein